MGIDTKTGAFIIRYAFFRRGKVVAVELAWVLEISQERVRQKDEEHQGGQDEMLLRIRLVAVAWIERSAEFWMLQAEPVGRLAAAPKLHLMVKSEREH